AHTVSSCEFDLGGAWSCAAGAHPGCGSRRPSRHQPSHGIADTRPSPSRSVFLRPLPPVPRTQVPRREKPRPLLSPQQCKRADLENVRVGSSSISSLSTSSCPTVERRSLSETRRVANCVLHRGAKNCPRIAQGNRESCENSKKKIIGWTTA